MTNATHPVQFFRRGLFALIALAGLAGATSAPAIAQTVTSDQAVSFINTLGNQIVGLINEGVDSSSRRQGIQTVVDRDVDVDGIAKFCLGRFWRIATPDQQQQYLMLFHDVLMRSVTANLGDYQGVTFKVGTVVPSSDGNGVAVQTVLTRPNNAPNNVQWLVISKGGGLKVSDLVVEGTSLKLTKREEYASYLQNNGNNVDALIAALKAQAQS